MSAVELLDVNAVAPDSVEVVESYRTWKFLNGQLLSHNGIVWKPGEALHAVCRGGTGAGFEVVLVRRGMSLAKIAERIADHNQSQHTRYFYFTSMYGPTPSYSYLAAPTVEPPDGYGYAIQPLPHETPSEHCTCGVYSGTTLDICPAGDVRGKVKLWGKLVPGEKGYRAEYAYPSEFIVPAALAEDPALLAFGVPITIDESAPKSIGGLTQFISTNSSTFTFTGVEPPHKAFPWLKFFIVLNLGSAALNLSLSGLRLLG